MLLGMPVAVASSSAARPLGAAPDHRDAAFAVGVGERAQRGRLAGAGDPDDADDPVRAAGGLVDEHLLLAVSGRGSST